eukprot:6395804-Prymnesium_polylepis.1
MPKLGVAAARVAWARAHEGCRARQRPSRQRLCGASGLGLRWVGRRVARNALQREDTSRRDAGAALSSSRLAQPTSAANAADTLNEFTARVGSNPRPSAGAALKADAREEAGGERREGEQARDDRARALTRKRHARRVAAERRDRLEHVVRAVEAAGRATLALQLRRRVEAEGAEAIVDRDDDDASEAREPRAVQRDAAALRESACQGAVRVWANADHVPDTIEKHVAHNGNHVLYESKAYTPLKTSDNLGNGTARGGGSSSTAAGNLVAF